MLKNKKECIYYFAAIVLGLSIIMRLIDQSKMIWAFPLDYANDASSFMAVLTFLAKYGFHGIAPEWYGGFTVLKFYSPAWFYFALPAYLFTQNVQFAAYLSLIFLYIFGAALIFLFGRLSGWSSIKSLAFFALFFGNAIAIGNFIRLGSYPFCLAWVFLTALFLLFAYYKDKNLTLRFYLLFIPLLAIIILAHPQETILSAILLLSFFLVKKEKIKIFAASLISLAITSFWWYPFLRDLSQSRVSEYVLTETLLSFTGEWAMSSIAAIIISLGAIGAFFCYWHSKGKPRKELIFFAPAGILAVLVLTKLIVFMPYLNQMYIDALNLCFIMLALYYLFSINFEKLRPLAKFAIIGILIMAPAASAAYTHFKTPYFQEHSELAKDVLSVLTAVKGTYLIMGVPAETAYSRAFYSYAAIYLNLSTASGWATHELSYERQALLMTAGNAFNSNNCEEMLSPLKSLSVAEIISYKEHCIILEKCGFVQKSKKNDVCLLAIT